MTTGGFNRPSKNYKRNHISRRFRDSRGLKQTTCLWILSKNLPSKRNRKCYSVRQSDETPETWEEFRKEFIEAFQSQTFKARAETRLRERKQRPGESALGYYYDVLDLCRQIEEAAKIDCLLAGLQPSLLKKMLPLIPEQITNVKMFFKHLQNQSQTKELVELSKDKEHDYVPVSLARPGENGNGHLSRIDPSWSRSPLVETVHFNTSYFCAFLVNVPLMLNTLLKTYIVLCEVI